MSFLSTSYIQIQPFELLKVFKFSEKDRNSKMRRCHSFTSPLQFFFCFFSNHVALVDPQRILKQDFFSLRSWLKGSALDYSHCFCFKMLKMDRSNHLLTERTHPGKKFPLRTQKTATEFQFHCLMTAQAKA